MTLFAGVVIRTRGDRPEWLREALDSVVAQSYEQTYVVVVIDGSCATWMGPPYDRVTQLLGRHATRRGLIATVTGRLAGDGRASAANRGVRFAPADYITFLDDDDVLKPDHVDLLMRAAGEHPDVGIFYSDVAWVAADGNNRPLKVEHVYDGEVSLESLRERNGKPFNAYLFKRELLEHELLRDEDAPCEDWGLLLRLANAGHKMVHVPATTAEYRRRNGHGSTSDPALMSAKSLEVRRRYGGR